MNKFNKKAILTAHTADICRRVVFRCRKTLVFGIIYNTLVINLIDFFDGDKHTNQFQELPFLEAKTTVSC